MDSDLPLMLGPSRRDPALIIWKNVESRPCSCWTPEEIPRGQRVQIRVTAASVSHPLSPSHSVCISMCAANQDLRSQMVPEHRYSWGSLEPPDPRAVTQGRLCPLPQGIRDRDQGWC